MRHLEIHLVQTLRESRLLGQSGLPLVHLEPQECGGCGRPIGVVNEHFVPVGIVLDQHSLAYVCEPCLHSVLKVLPDLDSRGVVW